jgi:hypothetical protein
MDRLDVDRMSEVRVEYFQPLQHVVTVAADP